MAFLPLEKTQEMLTTSAKAVFGGCHLSDSLYPNVKGERQTPKMQTYIRQHNDLGPFGIVTDYILFRIFSPELLRS